MIAPSPRSRVLLVFLSAARVSLLIGMQLKFGGRPFVVLFPLPCNCYNCSCRCCCCHQLLLAWEYWEYLVGAGAARKSEESTEDFTADRR